MSVSSDFIFLMVHSGSFGCDLLRGIGQTSGRICSYAFWAYYAALFGQFPKPACGFRFLGGSSVVAAPARVLAGAESAGELWS